MDNVNLMNNNCPVKIPQPIDAEEMTALQEQNLQACRPDIVNQVVPRPRKIRFAGNDRLEFVSVQPSDQIHQYTVGSRDAQ